MKLDAKKCPALSQALAAGAKQLKEKDIKHENGNFWVADEGDAYTVYKTGATHSTSDSSYAHDADGLSIAKARCDYLAKRFKTESKLDATKYPLLSKFFSTAAGTMEYKLRAECIADVIKLLPKLKISEYKISSEFPPDVEFEFKSDRSLDEIKKFMESISDSHVMSETVALKKDYTGER